MFKKQTKRLHKNEIHKLAQVIKQIANGSSIDIAKKGDLSGVFVL